MGSFEAKSGSTYAKHTIACRLPKKISIITFCEIVNFLCDTRDTKHLFPRSLFLFGLSISYYNKQRKEISLVTCPSTNLTFSVQKTRSIHYFQCERKR